MIRLKDIRKSYRMGAKSLHVLQGVSAHIEAGEMVAIMGASGSGKSTLLHVMGLLDKHDSGEYRLDGEVVRDLSETESARLRSKKVGFVFQAFNLVTFKTALENVALPLYYQGVSRKKRNVIAAELLEQLGLLDWAGHLPTEMSGGQQQRVAIARALVTKPRVLFADDDIIARTLVAAVLASPQSACHRALHFGRERSIFFYWNRRVQRCAFVAQIK